MRKSITLVLRLFLAVNIFLCTNIVPAQNVGIGTNTPHASAKLEVTSTNSGFLPPRMTQAQRNAISNPVAGLIVWCSDCGTGGELSVFNGTDWAAANFTGNVSGGTIPLAPTNLQATVSSPLQYAGLSWTDISTNESGYKIERKTDSGFYAPLAQVGSNVTGYNDSSINQSSTYFYRVYAYNNSGNSAQYSNEVQVITLAAPTVFTANISSISNTSANSGGDVINSGGATVTVRGICWSTVPNPTIALVTKTINGGGIGTYVSNLNGLTPNSVYYVRAYASNTVGTSYGQELSFTTTNNSVTNLPSVNIGTQIWSSKNLDVPTYRNGDPIPQVTDPTQWASLTTGAWCWYNNDSATYGSIYGRLYNWYAVNDPRGLAPQGWHVPNEAEWNKLVKYLDAAADTICQDCSQSSIAGGAMKSTVGWNSPNTGATNSVGFTGLPGGIRGIDASFGNIGVLGVWWSKTEADSTAGFCRLLTNDSSSLFRFIAKKTIGFSLRVVKD
jgi:uncharacterized protein (TIGR02145 family)